MDARENQLQLLVRAQQQLLSQKLDEAFNPEKPDSRPTPDQDAAFRAVSTHDFVEVSGGNQSGKRCGVFAI